MTTELTEPKYRPFKLRDIFFGFLFFAWSQIAMGGIVRSTNLMGSGETAAAVLTSLLIAAGDVGIIIKAYKVIKRSIEVEEDTSPPIRWKEIGSLFAILITMVLCLIAVNIIVGNAESTNQDALLEMFRMSPILSTFHIIIMAPVCEDLCFRYYALRPGSAWWLRFFVSGTIFLMIHLIGSTDPRVVISYLVPTCFLCGTRLLYNSVRYSMALHAMYNGVVVLVSMLPYLVLIMPEIL